MVINIKNKKNWSGNGHYVGRPSPLSNPFIITELQSRIKCIKAYANMLRNEILDNNPTIISALSNLYSYLLEHNELNLVCYCSPLPCHAEVIKQVLLNKLHTGYWLVKNKEGEYII